MKEADAIVEFVGGPYDGYIVDTRDTDRLSVTLAQFVCLATDHGQQIGKVLQGCSLAAMEAIVEKVYRGQGKEHGFRRDHKYKLIHRSVTRGRVVIRMEYVS